MYDFTFHDGEFTIAIDVVDFLETKEKLKKIQCILEESYLGYFAPEKLELSEKENEKIAEFIEALEEVEDIQNIYVNT